MRTVATLSLLALLAACVPSATVPLRPANFSYQTAKAAKKSDVTIAVAGGQLGQQYQGQMLILQTRGAIMSDMVRALRTSFAEMLSSKGFNTTGPFESVEAMSYPEKKGADFVMYADLEFAPPCFRVEAAQALASALTGRPACNLVFQPKGDVTFVALEPLSKEKMWVKRISFAVPAGEPLMVMGGICVGQAFNEDLSGTPEVANARTKANEAVFTQIMASLDKFVSPDEFQDLKRQSAEIRKRKIY